MRRRNTWLALQGLVTVLLLGLLVRGLDLNAFRTLFVRLPLWFYVLSLAVVVAGQIAYAWRWRLLLAAAGVDVAFPVIVRQYFIGIFLNNFLPSTVGGDLAKVYLLGRDRGYRVVTASVLLYRVLGVGWLALLAAVILWMVPLPSPVLAVARLAVTAIAAVAMVLLAVVVAGTGGLAERVSWLGQRAVDLAERLHRLRFDMAAALTSPRVLGQSSAVVLGYFLVVAGVYVIFLTMQDGHAPAFAMTLGVVMATSVLSNIPISLNGLGFREQLHAVLLVPLGVPPEVAVAISLLLFGHLIVASLFGLVFWLQTPARPPEPPAAVITV